MNEKTGLLFRWIEPKGIVLVAKSLRVSNMPYIMSGK